MLNNLANLAVLPAHFHSTLFVRPLKKSHQATPSSVKLFLSCRPSFFCPFACATFLKRRQVFVKLVKCSSKALLHPFELCFKGLALRFCRVDWVPAQRDRRPAALLGKRQYIQDFQRPIQLKRGLDRTALRVRKGKDKDEPLRRNDVAIDELAHMSFPSGDCIP